MAPASSPSDPRVLSFLDAHNLRDLGGLTTRSGRRVRRGRVFRSDYPRFVEHDEGAAVRILGLRSVVDLRRAGEVEVECVDWESLDVAYRRWPLSAGGESSWHARYPAYLEHRPETVVGAVRAVMRPDRHGVLFHCAAGKDRTGVVAALLLSLLGVADDEIVADHVLSAGSVEAVLARLAGMEKYAAMLAGSSVADQQPRAEHLQALLDWLAERGGVEVWLTGHGALPSEISAFRTAMLED